MTRQMATAMALTVALAAPAVAGGREQLGKIGGVVKKAQQVSDFVVTDEEEQQLGAAVSERMRARFGVVQDAAVHRYVALVGGVLTQVSTKPNIPWTFIVLDTDGVNAFAAPGGFVHITRGALALMQNEAELAAVLSHEIIHITEKHTIKAMQKSKGIQIGANETLSGNAALINRLADNLYLEIIDKGFGRAEENESDEKGMALINKIGYAPQAMGTFLTRIQERNKDAKEKRGLFASHPEMKERIERAAKQIQSQKLTATATVEARFRKTITYKPVAQSEITQVADGAAGLAGSTEKPPEKKEEPPKEEPKKKGFGLGRLMPTGGGEQKNAQASASGGTRGLDPERNAKGGANPKIVPVKIVAADLTAFKKEGGLNP